MKKKYLFFCSRLGGGGAEMHLLRIINAAAKEGNHELHLALTRDGGNYEQFLDPTIKVHYLSSNNSSTKALIKSFFPLIKLSKTLRPDLIISFMDKQNSLLCLAKLFTSQFPKIVLCVQNAPKANLKNDNWISSLIARSIPFLYNKADYLISISKGVSDELRNHFRVRIPGKVIYNAGLDESIENRKKEPLPIDVKRNPNLQLVACGRLSTQKGFDTLFRSLARLNDGIDYTLWLVGDGPDKEKLQELAMELNISDKVSFLGFQTNPYVYFYNSDIFLLSSRWEGFGNVITEAMACEAAVISTDCDYGPNEIISNNKNGILVEVENASELASQIEYLHEDRLKMQELSKAGYLRSEFFTASKISAEYFLTLDKLANNE